MLFSIMSCMILKLRSKHCWWSDPRFFSMSYKHWDQRQINGNAYSEFHFLKGVLFFASGCKFWRLVPVFQYKVFVLNTSCDNRYNTCYHSFFLFCLLNLALCICRYNEAVVLLAPLQCLWICVSCKCTACFNYFM